jgi:hypothetical protein
MVGEIVKFVPDGSDIVRNFMRLLPSHLVQVVDVIEKSIDVVRQYLAGTSIRRNRIQHSVHRRNICLRRADANPERCGRGGNRRQAWKRHLGRRALEMNPCQQAVFKQ